MSTENIQDQRADAMLSATGPDLNDSPAGAGATGAAPTTTTSACLRPTTPPTRARRAGMSRCAVHELTEHAHRDLVVIDQLAAEVLEDVHEHRDDERDQAQRRARQREDGHDRSVRPFNLTWRRRASFLLELVGDPLERLLKRRRPRRRGPSPRTAARSLGSLLARVGGGRRLALDVLTDAATLSRGFGFSIWSSST